MCKSRFLCVCTHTGRPHFVALHGASKLLCFFLQIEDLWQRCMSVSAIFLTTFAHFVFLCHTLVIRTILKNFSLLLHLLG